MEAKLDNAPAHVITVSDGVAAGTRTDASGALLVEILGAAGFDVSGPTVVADEKQQISDAVLAAIGSGARLVVTTGGTGLGPRDVTPQATAALLDYEVPGLGEVMRRAGVDSTPMASLSRSLAGVRGGALILNLPGSRAGARESLEAVMPVLGHALQLLRGDTRHR